MGLFSDMGKFGLGKFENTEIINDGTKKQASANAGPAGPAIVREADILFDKHYTCPVCDINFTAKCVRVGKLKAVGRDSDLRPVYEFADPLKYDVITCDKCGYSALNRYFGKLSTRQIKDIREQVSSCFKGVDDSMEEYSYDDAIIRHKLAVICSVVKNAKNSERAYTCLKLAWVIRGKRETVKPDSPEYKQLYFDEMEAIKNAYEGLYKSISNETFPIAGMDENTLKYILADLARKLKKYDEASRFVSSVLTSRGASNRLKDEALKLKEMIKQDIKNGN